MCFILFPDTSQPALYMRPISAMVSIASFWHLFSAPFAKVSWWEMSYLSFLTWNKCYVIYLCFYSENSEWKFLFERWCFFPSFFIVKHVISHYLLVHLHMHVPQKLGNKYIWQNFRFGHFLGTMEKYTYNYLLMCVPSALPVVSVTSSDANRSQVCVPWVFEAELIINFQLPYIILNHDCVK